MRTNPVKTGFALGFLLAFYHTCWSVLVATGGAQPLLDFILWAHFLKLSIQVEPFDLHQASILVGATAIIGFALGAVLGLIWNLLHPQRK